jgi:hypothetical protein
LLSAQVITAGLVGLRAAFGHFFIVEPLADASIKYFALDNVAYHGHNLSIAYDSQGQRYAKQGCMGGLCVWIDGRLKYTSPQLARLNCSLL